MNNMQNLTSFVFTDFKVKHQTNGACFLITQFICKTRNIFLLNKDDLIKLNTKNKIKIFHDNSIKVYIIKSKDGKKHKYLGNNKYLIIVKELNNNSIDDFTIDEDYESDGTCIMSNSD